MRLLAIRGKNLASLREFKLELHQPPLSDAGLFAISGPTGSGKSTLLDALCVALFDKTPRLSKSGGVPIGHENQHEKDRIPANDVRNILRHGTGSGFAEVDFLGCDDRRYRARWEVRRARERPHGRMQKQTLSLTDLERDELISDNKKNSTLSLIEAKLGLDFDQFCRSVLLAQGEFTAFLRAKPADRGKLLERMTGTRIYSELSKAAHERQKAETEALQALESDIATSALLTDDEREALEGKRDLATEQVQTLEDNITAADQAIAWHHRAIELGDAETRARQAKLEREAEWQTLQPVRRELNVTEAARTHLPLLQAVEQRQTAHTLARARLSKATDAERIAREQATHTAEQRRLDRDALDQARARHDQYTPMLERADRLDTEIEVAGQSVSSTRNDWHTATTRQRRTESELQQLQQHLDETRAEKQQIDAWLERHRYASSLVREWPRWDRDLERYAAARRAHDLLHNDRTNIEIAKTNACDQRALATQELERARRARDDAQAEAEDARRRASSAPLEHIRTQRHAMTERVNTLDQLQDAADRARAAATSRQQAIQQANDARSNAERGERQCADLSTALENLELRIEEADATLERMRLTVQLSAHRNTLEPGHPCPLCGALEHPDADASSPETRLLDQQREHLDQLRTRRDQQNERRTTIRGQIEASYQRARESDTERDQATAALDSARETWTELVGALTEPGQSVGFTHPPASSEAALALGTHRATVATELREITARERDAEALQKAASNAQRVALDCEQALTAAIAQDGTAAEQERKTTERLEHITRDMDKYAADMSEIARALSNGIHINAAAANDPSRGPDDHLLTDDIEASLKRDPVGVHRACSALVEDYTDHQTRASTAEQTLTQLNIKLESLTANLTEYQTRVAQLDDTLTRSTEALSALREQRAEILSGRQTSKVRAQLAAERQRLEQVLAESSERSQQAARQMATTEVEARAAATAAEREQAELEHAQANLHQALERTGGNLEEVRKRCEVSATWLQQQRARIDAAEQALREARTVLTERLSQHEKHQSTGRPATTLEELRARADSDRAERKRAYGQISDMEHRLRLDDEARNQRAHMAKTIAAQQKRTHLYQTLHHLIGSADGNKFRVFAQSLTLDALLAFANHHLQDLAGRYRLVRVPGYHLDLQIIDQNMGDEVRSINSLSGGESFLVSLALALGLSSLAARDTRVESLLIDEGFGSLDSATLEVALSVLDALQATGRQVAVISHVPGLAERIGVCIRVKPRGSGRSIIQISER